MSAAGLRRIGRHPACVATLSPKARETFLKPFGDARRTMRAARRADGRDTLFQPRDDFRDATAPLSRAVECPA